MRSKSLKHNKLFKKRIVLMTILFCFFSIPAIFAGDFEGEILYEISYEDGIEKQILEVLPKKSTSIVKNKKFISFSKSPLGNQGLIYDHRKGVSYALTDIFKTPLAIKKTATDLARDREQFKIINIKHTKESKLILGYSCKKVIVTAYIPKIKQNIDFEAFYTITLGNTDWINEADPIYYQLKGFLLEYEIQLGSVFMKMKATKITPRKVSDSEFKIPKTHTIVTPKEAEKLLKK